MVVVYELWSSSLFQLIFSLASQISRVFLIRELELVFVLGLKLFSGDVRGDDLVRISAGRFLLGTSASFVYRVADHAADAVFEVRVTLVLLSLSSVPHHRMLLTRSSALHLHRRHLASLLSILWTSHTRLRPQRHFGARR